MGISHEYGATGFGQLGGIDSVISFLVNSNDSGINKQKLPIPPVPLGIDVSQKGFFQCNRSFSSLAHRVALD
jgi:hypothetical protein